MAIDDMDDLELDPSTSETTLDDAADPQGAAAAANSSVATDETDASPLSIVRDVVGARDDKSSAASSAEGSEAGEGADGAATNQPDNENYSDVPFNKHPRFRELLNQTREFKVDAERYRNVQTFLDNNGLSAEEAADGLLIMGLMKTDPAEAWKMLRPRVQALLVAAGEVLPDDLQARVQKGELTPDAATEISRSRAQLASVNTRTSFKDQQEQRRRDQSHATTLFTAATDWETDRRTKDPNFEAKLIPLQKEIAYLQLREGKPTDAEGVKKQLATAYKNVNASFIPPKPTPKAVTQQRPAVRPITGGQVSGNAKPEPKNTLDIVRANRRTASA